jgi:hypothetical protein
MMLCPSQITKLEPDQCICRECGLSRVGYQIKGRFRGDEGYTSCENGCTYTGSDVEVEVFTQQDIEDGLPEASGADWAYIREYFPNLAKVAEQAEFHTGQQATKGAFCLMDMINGREGNSEGRAALKGIVQAAIERQR